MSEALRLAIENLEAAQQHLLRNTPNPAGYNPARDVLANLVTVGELLRGAYDAYEQLVIPAATDIPPQMIYSEHPTGRAY